MLYRCQDCYINSYTVFTIRLFHSVGMEPCFHTKLTKLESSKTNDTEMVWKTELCSITSQHYNGLKAVQKSLVFVSETTSPNVNLLRHKYY